MYVHFPSRSTSLTHKHFRLTTAFPSRSCPAFFSTSARNQPDTKSTQQAAGRAHTQPTPSRTRTSSSPRASWGTSRRRSTMMTARITTRTEGRRTTTKTTEASGRRSRRTAYAPGLRQGRAGVRGRGREQRWRARVWKLNWVRWRGRAPSRVHRLDPDQARARGRGRGEHREAIFERRVVGVYEHGLFFSGRDLGRGDAYREPDKCRRGPTCRPVHEPTA